MGSTLEEMQKWEEEVLKKSKREIHIMSELAEIGQFLLMAREILTLKPISQYEIERMLLIARESTTLATIMTSFLCPPGMRPALHFKPIMVYEVWSSLLQKKLDSWYNAYHKCGNRMTVFLKYGLEPNFFDYVGMVNPLPDTPFHELSLHKKACIMKALCSTMFQSNKKIEEYFNEVDEDALKPKLLYSDSKYEYVSLFSPEIRVYRASKICLDIDETIKSVLPSFTRVDRTDEDNERQPGLKEPFSKKQKFCLVAYDRETLMSLSKLFAKRKRGRAAINRLLFEDKNRELSFIGLRALHSQWNKAVYKELVSVEISKNYWIVKAASSANSGEDNSTEVSAEVSAEPVVDPPEKLGKRILKRKYPPEEERAEVFSSNDEKPNEDAVSDWEDGNIRRSRRIKKVSGLPRFFDRKYMKFENVNSVDYVYGSNFWKPGSEDNEVKKPRKKREKKNCDGTSADGQKVVRRKYIKKIGQNFLASENPLGIIQDEPYLPPLDLPKFVQSLQPLMKDDSSVTSAQPSAKNDLFDWGSWDFGMQAPLKPVDAPLPVPEDGEKKILELGAFKSNLTPPSSHNFPRVANSHPPKPVAPPKKHQIRPFFPGVPVMAQYLPTGMRPNLTIIQNGARGQLLPMPGPSSSNRVVLPWENMGKPRLLALDPRMIPADAMVLKTGPPPVKIPVHRPALQMLPPQTSSHFKRKVNLPARPLTIPVLNNQEVSMFKNQVLNSLESSSTVLYIPSGTPTITIPSVSGSNEEKTLTVL